MMNICSEHGIPRNGVSMRHLVKDLLCLYNITTLRIHVNKCIKHKPINGKSSTNQMAMHFFAQSKRPNSSTNFENSREGEKVRFNTFFYHLEVECNGVVIEAHLGIP
ncbi:hypothetical protein VIGAN_06263500 [Vigna angularis var. angularis]|uniref:Uncharacterized protein n=1 Tax=Vigna angularis var. angularis TaxID=157739 RepID=A0A0S3SER1_PHAAN|nr:hypothetical protein VIGAN_06263500 [Vigna angularis var. angularis]